MLPQLPNYNKELLQIIRWPVITEMKGVIYPFVGVHPKPAMIFRGQLLPALINYQCIEVVKDSSQACCTMACKRCDLPFIIGFGALTVFVIGSGPLDTGRPAPHNIAQIAAYAVLSPTVLGFLQEFIIGFHDFTPRWEMILISRWRRAMAGLLQTNYNTARS